MDLSDYRVKLDQIDSEIVRLFSERMDISAQIAEYKKSNSLPIKDSGREREKLAAISEQTEEKYVRYTEALYSLIFDLSRAYQRKLTGTDTDLKNKMMDAIEKTPKVFPERPVIACQGVEGAYSQQACEKMIAHPNIMYFTSFEGVFKAIDSGLCQYGVLPLENSTAGSVNRIYDLMMKYDFSIVKSTRLKIDHSLLVNTGTKLGDIKAVYTHEQAIAQCESFLKTLKGVEIIPCENTAAAAKRVHESGRNDVAAIASRSCADLYDLDCLMDSVQDNSHNYTRFICISKKLEIYPGADKTSIMLVVGNKPGELYKTLQRFYSLGINLVKLESRPLPNSDFEFMFYFDLDTPVYSDRLYEMFKELDETCSTFRYLGSYSEKV